MKACILSAFLWVVLSVGSYGLVASEQLTPQNIAKQFHKFTIVPRTDNLGLFKITIESKDPSRKLPAFVVQLTLYDGEKRIATVPVATVKKGNSMEVRSFFVSADCLAKSVLAFDIDPDTTFWFYLKDFIAP